MAGPYTYPGAPTILHHICGSAIVHVRNPWSVGIVKRHRKIAGSATSYPSCYQVIPCGVGIRCISTVKVIDDIARWLGAGSSAYRRISPSVSVTILIPGRCAGNTHLHKTAVALGAEEYVFCTAIEACCSAHRCGNA